VPRVDSGELDTALAFLNFNRESVLKKTEGLDGEQLRRVLVGTGTNLLGLVQHLTQAERNWFGYHLTGAERVRGPGSGMRVARDRTTQEVLGQSVLGIWANRRATSWTPAQKLRTSSIGTRACTSVHRRLNWRTSLAEVGSYVHLALPSPKINSTEPAAGLRWRGRFP
jgi:Protein of unknown function (DUF664)